MSVANLTRYTEFLRYDGHTSAALMVESSTGAYVKFEEAKVASSNSVQQLKAEIRSLIAKYDSYRMNDAEKCPGWILHELRELSAV